MKKCILSLVLTLLLIFALAPVLPLAAPGDAISFPDPNFEAAVRDWIDKPTGQITQSEAAEVTQLYVAFSSIASLSGIEYFTSLTMLTCNNNQLTELDLSKNTALERLSCEGNQLTELNVNNCSGLTQLLCYDNQLTRLDINNNTLLKNLSCQNNRLTELDIKKNTELLYLFCSDNFLANLDVSSNTMLEDLRCSNNQLEEIDVSANTTLEHFDCSGNLLTELNISKNTMLEYLECSGNQLKELDISKNAALRSLITEENNMPGKAAIIGLDASRISMFFYPQKIYSIDFDTAAKWALSEIYSALNKGFVPEEIQNGYSDVITRQEFCRMAVMFVEYALYNDIDIILSDKGLTRDPDTFTDTSDPYILAAFALGITNGTKAPTDTAPGTFTPDGQFSRQEAATMLMRVCIVIGIDAESSPPAPDFVDMDDADIWAHEGISYVRAIGIMNGTSATTPTFSPKGTFTRQESIVTFDRIR